MSIQIVANTLETWALMLGAFLRRLSAPWAPNPEKNKSYFLPYLTQSILCQVDALRSFMVYWGATHPGALGAPLSNCEAEKIRATHPGQSRRETRADSSNRNIKWSPLRDSGGSTPIQYGDI